MSVLAKEAVVRAMEDPDNPLVITPMLDIDQIGAASVDVRLRHEFIVMRRGALASIDPMDREQIPANLYRFQEKTRIALDGQFVVHPRELILGATLEYVALPLNIAATVEGRSSWGRLGLLIATASTIAPGYKGCITLEIVNEGTVPLILRPGVRIAQLIFFRTEGTATYDGRYDCPTGPQFSRIYNDKDLVWLSRCHRTRSQVPVQSSVDADELVEGVRETAVQRDTDR